eukprot:1024066_1
METLQRKQHNRSIQHTPAKSAQHAHHIRSRPVIQETHNYQCDWLLCLIFCLGFIVASLIFCLGFALIHYQSLYNHSNTPTPKFDPDASLGTAVIDYSREMDESKLIKSDIPPPLPPLQSKEIETNPIYQSFRDEIDIMKLPINCSLVDQLYECKGVYFNNFTHYHHDWSASVGTAWEYPEHVSMIYTGSKRKYEQWRYNIINYPIIPLYLTSNKPRDGIEITIVTQTSMDRLHLIEMIASNWRGVISLAIYIRLEESLLHAQQLITESFERIETKYDAILDISLLFETDYLYKRQTDKGLYSVMYPVNHLRNVALQSAKTDLILLTDGDFVTSHAFHDEALQQWDVAMKHYNGNKSRPMVLVIPAFEYVNDTHITLNNMTHLPLDKPQIKTLYRQHKVRGFHTHRCQVCHLPTKYHKWMNKSNPYSIRYQTSYEPYVMTTRVGIHRYDARFRGYGWNKIMHLLTLAWLDKAQWVVASDVFIFHIAHNSSRDSKTYFKGTNSSRWEWVTGLARMALKSLKRGKDQSGVILA